MHWVRINALDTQWWREDLEAVMPAAPVGIVLPKSAGPDSIAQLSAEIYELENRHGLPNNSTKILALVSETARAAATIPAYVGASMPRLAGLTWGAEDLSAAIGASRKRTETGGWSDTFRFVRSQTLLTAHAQGVLAIDTLHSDFRDNAGLEKIAADARADGFDGMLAIHPAQVPIINKAFAPTEAEIARARSIVALFEANPGAGALQLDGDMIDQPHLVQARKLLDEVKDDPPRRVV
jgi:citrate lyase subunit beta/citryl-CoA lyase